MTVLLESMKELETIRIPTGQTLHKYGLSVMEWLELYNKKGGCCHACGKKFKYGQRMNIDHQHVRGWKQMPPEQRKIYIRGLLCFTCNRFITMRGVSSERLLGASRYLRNWEVRVTSEG